MFRHSLPSHRYAYFHRQFSVPDPSFVKPPSPLITPQMWSMCYLLLLRADSYSMTLSQHQKENQPWHQIQVHNCSTHTHRRRVRKLPLTNSVPAFTSVAPICVFLPDNSSVPDPSFVKPPSPLITPLNAVDVLSPPLRADSYSMTLSQHQKENQPCHQIQVHNSLRDLHFTGPSCQKDFHLVPQQCSASLPSHRYAYSYPTIPARSRSLLR